MTFANLGSGVIILGSRTELPPQLGTIPILTPLVVGIATISAYALAETLASSTQVMSGSQISAPGQVLLISGVKQEAVADIGIIGSGSISFSMYSLQPSFATIPAYAPHAITGTLVQTGWIASSTVPSAFRMYNDPQGVPLSPLTEIQWIPSGTIATWMNVTMTFR
jgi:hypothetical protein